MWDGVQGPRISVEVAYGATSLEDLRAAGIFILGESVLGGPDVLGTLSWVEIVNDVISLSYGAGFDDEISGAQPATSTVVLDGSTGSYDPTVAESPLSLAGHYPSPTRFPSTTDFPRAAPVSGPVDASEVDVGKPLRVSYWWADETYSAFTHTVDKIRMSVGLDPVVTFECVDGLEALGRAPIPELAVPSFAGDTADQRLTRILDLAQWPTGHRSLETGLVILAETTLGGQALPLAQEVADTEMGRLYIDPDGILVFTNRMHIYTAARSLTVQATITDAGGANVEAYDQSPPEVVKDRGRVYNQAHVTRTGGVEQFAEDVASRAKYGPREYPGAVGALAPTDGDAFALASWLVSQYATPRTEVRELVIDATGQGMWATLLPLRLFDRLRFVRDYGPVTVDRELLLFGYRVDIGPDEWQITMSTVDPTTFVPFVLGTSVLGGTHRLA